MEVKRVVGVCKCDPNYNYALDCSIFGRKYISLNSTTAHCKTLLYRPLYESAASGGKLRP